MAIITIPRTATYAEADQILTDNPDRWYVVEIDNGVVAAPGPMVRAEFDDLAPGESFTIIAVCDTAVEADSFVDGIRS